MPIKWVLYWQTNPGTPVSTQILTEVTQCIEGINGTKGSRWKSTVYYYKPTTRDPSMPVSPELPRELVGVALQEQPNKHYFVLRGQRILVEADNMIPVIMEKLQSYRSRGVIHFEGFHYQLGDFLLRIGKVVAPNTDSVRGIIMEMEYLPISSIEKSRQIMEEFLDMWQEAVSKRSLPGRFMHVEPNFAEYSLRDHYTSQHTVVQYAAIINNLLSTGRN
ncbi:hypothetical protein ACHQM5_001679 [Ranunculus cassubicifolius]